jgi:hypothetical protein
MGFHIFPLVVIRGVFILTPQVPLTSPGGIWFGNCQSKCRDRRPHGGYRITLANQYGEWIDR